MINPSTSALLKCNQTNVVWLFNCPEGSQHLLMKQKIRIHQINNIVLTNLSLENLAGLMGLLSSLSLNSRIYQINIYGPPGISNYLQFARKYSQTMFKYKLEVHVLSYGYIAYSLPNLIYAYSIDLKSNQIEYIILEKEKIGRFLLTKAKAFNLIAGPLYGYLKLQNRFITPDGYIIAGKFFTSNRSLGLKITYLEHKHGYRPSIEATMSSTEVIG